jgi:hypothetical protein
MSTICLNEQYITDNKGNKVGVFLDMEAYQKVLDMLDMFSDIQAYDAAKAQATEFISFDQAIGEIERGSL